MNKTTTILTTIILLTTFLLSACGSHTRVQTNSADNTADEIFEVFKCYESAYADSNVSKFLDVSPQQLFWKTELNAYESYLMSADEKSQIISLVDKALVFFNSVIGPMKYTVTGYKEFEHAKEEKALSDLLSEKFNVLKSATTDKKDFPFGGIGDTLWARFTSDSMAPTIRRGDVLLYSKCKDPSLLNVGDVILFRVADLNGDGMADYMTHRIVEKHNDNNHYSFTTKGDNVSVADREEVKGENVIGVWTNRREEKIGELFSYTRALLAPERMLYSDFDITYDGNGNPLDVKTKKYEKVLIAEVNLECTGKTYPCEFVVLKADDGWRIANPFWFMSILFK